MAEFNVPQKSVSTLSSASLVSALPHQLIEQKETEIAILHSSTPSSVSSLPDLHYSNEQDYIPKPAKPQNGAAAIPKFDDMSTLQVGLILLSLGFALFMFAIEETIVATSVSSIGAALDIKSSLTWISTSYLLTTAVIQPIIGRISDLVGSKRLLLIELWIFVLGNVIAGTSKTLTQIIVGRLISGIGGAGLMSGVSILIAQLTHERQRSTYMTLVNVVFIITDAAGPVLGAGLAKSGNWRWIFLLNAPIAPVITFLLVRWLDFPPPDISSTINIRSFRDVISNVDILGMFTLVCCLSFLVVALNSGGQTVAWNSSLIIGMLCALGISGIAFCVVESRYAKMPIAPGRLFVRWGWRNVPLMMANRVLMFSHNFAMIFYIPIFLQVTGYSIIVSSALVIPFLAMSSVSGAIVNIIASKYGYMRTICICGISIVPIGVGLMSTLNENSSVWRVIGFSLIYGFGFGTATQITMVIAQVGLPEDELSTVTALVGAAPALGGTFGVAIVGSVINNVYHEIVQRSAVASTFIANNGSITILLNASNVITSISSLPSDSPVRHVLVEAYVSAWQKGCYALVGMAGLQLVLCAIMRRVEFNDPSSKIKSYGIGLENQTEVEEAKA